MERKAPEKPNGTLNETPGETFSRGDMIAIRTEFFQDLAVMAFDLKRTAQALKSPEDHAGIEKAAKALSALNKAAREIFDAALDAPGDDEKTEDEDMADYFDSDREPDENDLAGWRNVLERKIGRVVDRRPMAELVAEPRPGNGEGHGAELAPLGVGSPAAAAE